MREKHKIDFIVTWVDGGDPEWLRNKARFLGDEHDRERIDTSAERYREWGHLRYWFRAVEKYAPWVNRIHYITCGHIPEWLNTEAPKLNLVRYEDYVPQD